MTAGVVRGPRPTTTPGERGPLSLFPRPPPPPSDWAPRAGPTKSTAGRLKRVISHINLANPVHHLFFFFGPGDKQGPALRTCFPDPPLPQFTPPRRAPLPRTCNGPRALENTELCGMPEHDRTPCPNTGRRRRPKACGPLCHASAARRATAHLAPSKSVRAVVPPEGPTPFLLHRLSDLNGFCGLALGWLWDGSGLALGRLLDMSCV